MVNLFLLAKRSFRCLRRSFSVTVLQRSGRTGICAGLIALAVCLGVCSCKVWRTVSTSATYVQQNDSAKTTTSIATKTVEEYHGVKKR